MISEYNQVKRYLGIRFGYGNPIPDGTYAVPTQTSKGNAFMKMEFKDEKTVGEKNFHLYWDEKLTIDWYSNPKPLFLTESKFAKLFRKIDKVTKYL